MLKKFFYKKKLNKKGFTLIELVCTIAILAIVGISIGAFISFSTRTYKNATYEVNLQEEAQQTANLIKNLIMDANRGITMYTPAGANPYLVVYNLSEGVDGAGNACASYDITKIEYKADLGEIYYVQAHELVADADRETFLDTYNVENLVTTDLLAKHISGFVVDTSDINKNYSVKVNIDFENRGSEYKLSNVVNLRNRIGVASSLREVYSATPVQSIQKITNVSITQLNGVRAEREYRIIRPNNNIDGSAGFEDYSFSSLVTAIKMSDLAGWTLTTSEGNPVTESTVDSSGLLRISSKETNRDMILTAYSMADPSVKDTVIIHVLWPYVETFNISCVSTSVTNESEAYQTFTFGCNITYCSDKAQFSAPTVPYSLMFYEDEECTVPLSWTNGFSYDAASQTVKCTFEASEKTFWAVARSRIHANGCADASCKDDGWLDIDGNVCESKIECNVSEIAIPEPTISLTTSETSLIRGGGVDVDVDSYTYLGTSPVFSWSIEYIGDNWTDADKGKITITDLSGNKKKIKIADDLAYNKELSFKVVVKGNGNYSGVSRSKEVKTEQFTVGKAVLHVSVVCEDNKLLRGSVYNVDVTADNCKKVPSVTLSMSTGSTPSGISLSHYERIIHVSEDYDWDKKLKFAVKASTNGAGGIEAISQEVTIEPVSITLVNKEITDSISFLGYRSGKAMWSIGITGINVESNSVNVSWSKTSNNSWNNGTIFTPEYNSASGIYSYSYHEYSFSKIKFNIIGRINKGSNIEYSNVISFVSD